jgi:hypothetical protein
VNRVETHVLTYKNGKIRHVETILRRGKGTKGK